VINFKLSVYSLHVSKGRILLILGHVGQGQRLRLLKNEKKRKDSVA